VAKDGPTVKVTRGYKVKKCISVSQVALFEYRPLYKMTEEKTPTGAISHLGHLGDSVVACSTKRRKVTPYVSEEFDIIHSQCKFSDLALSIINTSEFKRLKRIKQLAMVHVLYPSATHCRYSHSVGVYRLTGMYIDALIKNTVAAGGAVTADDICSPRMIELIKVAGLVHDIGHGMFSHLFDHYFATQLGVPKHEQRGVQLFRRMVAKYSLKLTPEEVDLICSIILGKVNSSTISSTEKLPGDFSPGKPTMMNVPPWFGEIVNNQRFELDTDKLDYLLRDAYYTRRDISIRFELNAVLENCKIDLSTGHIVFRSDIYEEINAIFTARHRMHKLVYQNPVTVAAEMMISNYLKVLFELPEMRDLIRTPEGWLIFTDDVLNWFDNPLLGCPSAAIAPPITPASPGVASPSSEVTAGVVASTLSTASSTDSRGRAQRLQTVAERCRKIKNDLDSGLIPKLVARSMVKTIPIRSSKIQVIPSSTGMKRNCDADGDTDDGGVFMVDEIPISIDFSSKKFNPMDNVEFYDDSSATVRNIKPDDVSKLVKSDVHENWVYTFSHRLRDVEKESSVAGDAM
jgi:HD superfamily phosphohydrolase